MIIKSNRTDFYPLLITVLWIIVIFAVNPLHNFPLNDDWAYHRTLLDLLQTGKLKYEFWVGVPLVPHLFWGYIFVKIFGFSFSILRIANLIMGLAGLFATYFLFKELIRSRKRSFIYTLFVGFNPIYLHLCFTYMSDLTFYTMVAFSMYFYLKHIRKHTGYSLEWSFLFALGATMTRQIGMFLPVAILLHQVVMERGRSFKVLIKPLIYSSIVFLSLHLFTIWLEATDNKPLAYRELSEMLQIENALSSISWQGLIQLGHWFLEGGLWFLPLVLFGVVESKKLIRRHYIKVILFTLLLLPVIIRMSADFPRGNIFYDFGLGPKTLTGEFLLGMNPYGHPSSVFLWIIKISAIVGGTGLACLVILGLIQMVQRMKKGMDLMSLAKLFSFLLILVYYGVLLISFTFFDRYLTALFIPLLILIIPASSEDQVIKDPRWKTSLIALYLAVLLTFGIASTRDYMQWNAVRWTATKYLEDQGIDPGKIDGGFEYNGWTKKELDLFGRWDPARFDYMIASSGIQSLDTLMVYKYQNLLPYEKRKMFILKR